MINPLDWDLGNVPPSVAWGGVDEAGRGAWAGPVVAACAVLDGETVRKCEIPKRTFVDLLTAFRQDQKVSRYSTFADVLDYCHYSANPVGRLVAE